MSTKQHDSRSLNPARGKWRCVSFTILFVIVSLVQVEACPVCFLLPQKTAADLLIEGECVVLARENPQMPFSYLTTEILKGQRPTEGFGLFIDSATRRRLKANPDCAVVLVRMSGEESWQSLGVANHQYQEVLKRILAFSERWASDEGAHDRYKFFLPLLGSKNRTVFELAYLELGRAPYSAIRKMARLVPPKDIRRVLHQREYFEWRSLAILLLAQNPNEQDRLLIERSFNACHKFSLTTNLAAWTTAIIELKGPEALDEIEEKYFQDTGRRVGEIRAVVTALSVQGRHGSDQLRNRIVACYGIALQNHPQMAGPIVNDLAHWKQRAHRAQIGKILQNPDFVFDKVEKRALKTYLRH